MLGPSELAAALGVSRNCIYKYEREGKLPKRRNGGWDIDEARAKLGSTVGSKKGGVPRTGERENATPPKREGPKVAPKASATSPPPKESGRFGEIAKTDLEKALLAVRTKNQELDFQERSRKLISADEVRRALSDMVAAAKSRLRTMGNSLAPELAIEADAAKIRSMIDGEVDQALSDLARWEPRAA